MAGAAALAELAAKHGLATQALLAETRLRAFDLGDPRCRVSLADECRLISRLLQHTGHAPGLGLEAGRRVRFTALGPLGLAMVSSLSLRGALHAAARFGNLGCPSLHLHLQACGPGGKDLRLILPQREYPAELGRFVVERSLAAVLSLSSSLAQRPVRVVALELALDRADISQAYELCGGRAPLHGMAASALVLAQADLDAPLPHGDARMFKLAEAQCLGLEAGCRPRAGLAGEVRGLLSAHPSCLGDMAATAALLCMSERTLRRRLQDEGTSFVTLCDELRRTLAEQLLAVPRLPISDIAERLGYAEASSFIHAFKRWHGRTPRAFRSAAASV
ncbi:MAG: AraC family transcriptional regulator ligand-binding domain-containing protein [Proteobacteria bacterium]|nr:AraC family transcriptional regulator ligand-binding domain-containing protein [Pseudomonadota bacterium]